MFLYYLKMIKKKHGGSGAVADLKLPNYSVRNTELFCPQLTHDSSIWLNSNKRLNVAEYQMFAEYLN